MNAPAVSGGLANFPTPSGNCCPDCGVALEAYLHTQDLYFARPFEVRRPDGAFLGAHPEASLMRCLAIRQTLLLERLIAAQPSAKAERERIVRYLENEDPSVLPAACAEKIVKGI